MEHDLINRAQYLETTKLQIVVAVYYCDVTYGLMRHKRPKLPLSNFKKNRMQGTNDLNEGMMFH